MSDNNNNNNNNSISVSSNNSSNNNSNNNTVGRLPEIYLERSEITPGKVYTIYTVYLVGGSHTNIATYVEKVGVNDNFRNSAGDILSFPYYLYGIGWVATLSSNSSNVHGGKRKHMRLSKRRRTTRTRRTRRNMRR